MYQHGVKQTLKAGSIVFGLSALFLLIAPGIFLDLLGVTNNTEMIWSMRMIAITLVALAGISEGISIGAAWMEPARKVWLVRFVKWYVEILFIWAPMGAMRGFLLACLCCFFCNLFECVILLTWANLICDLRFTILDFCEEFKFVSTVGENKIIW